MNEDIPYQLGRKQALLTPSGYASKCVTREGALKFVGLSTKYPGDIGRWPLGILEAGGASYTGRR